MGIYHTRADLPPEQDRLIDVMLDEVGQQFENTQENIDAIREVMCVEPSTLRSLMKSLTLKGFLRRRKVSGGPTLLVVDIGAGGRIPAPPKSATCWECGSRRRQPHGACETCGAGDTQPERWLRAIS